MRAAALGRLKKIGSPIVAPAARGSSAPHFNAPSPRCLLGGGRGAERNGNALRRWEKLPGGHQQDGVVRELAFDQALVVEQHAVFVEVKVEVVEAPLRSPFRQIVGVRGLDVQQERQTPCRPTRTALSRRRWCCPADTHPTPRSRPAGLLPPRPRIRFETGRSAHRAAHSSPHGDAHRTATRPSSGGRQPRPPASDQPRTAAVAASRCSCWPLLRHGWAAKQSRALRGARRGAWHPRQRTAKCAARKRVFGKRRRGRAFSSRSTTDPRGATPPATDAPRSGTTAGTARLSPDCPATRRPANRRHRCRFFAGCPRHCETPATAPATRV